MSHIRPNTILFSVIL